MKFKMSNHFVPGFFARVEGDCEQHAEDIERNSSDSFQPPPRVSRQQLLRQKTGKQNSHQNLFCKNAGYLN